jgi:hypothetical protein
MASPDRSALRRRLAWLAASFALLALAGLAIWLARPDEPDPGPAPPPVPAPAPSPPAPIVEALSREDLVAAARAALLPPLTAAGEDRAPAVSGQRFQVVLPVRCPEALGAATGAHLTYNYDTVQAAVTLTARPQSWQGTPLVGPTATGAAFEAVEGFWIDPLPLAAPVCARTPAPAGPDSEDEPEQQDAEGDEAEAPPEPNVGLAVFYAAGGSRAVQRRDRPYRVTRKAPPPTGPAPYNLVLSGRVAPFEEGPAIRCQAPDGEPPACLVAATIDRVAFVAAETGEVLAEWAG